MKQKKSRILNSEYITKSQLKMSILAKSKTPIRDNLPCNNTFIENASLDELVRFVEGKLSSRKKDFLVKLLMEEVNAFQVHQLMNVEKSFIEHDYNAAKAAQDVEDEADYMNDEISMDNITRNSMPKETFDKNLELQEIEIKMNEQLANIELLKATLEQEVNMLQEIKELKKEVAEVSQLKTKIVFLENVFKKIASYFEEEEKRTHAYEEDYKSMSAYCAI